MKQQSLFKSVLGNGVSLTRRYGLRVLLLSAVSFSLVWMWMATTDYLPVKKISVTGDLQYITGDQLRDQVLPYIDKGFVRMDVANIRDAVEGLPWVYGVTVRRIWPDTVSLEVVEQQVLAYWGDSSLVNIYGEVFKPQSVKVKEAAPRFDGIEGLEKVMTERYRQYGEKLSTVSLNVVEVEVNKRRAWSLKLDNGIEIKLGREADADQLDRFVNVYETALGKMSSDISSVDLRYTNGFAVRWKKEKLG